MTRRECPATMECRLQSQCPQFLRQREQLESLSTGTVGYGQLLNRLKAKVCESATKKVCCAPVNREISGAIGPTLPHEFPFMVRLTIRVKLICAMIQRYNVLHITFYLVYHKFITT